MSRTGGLSGIVEIDEGVLRNMASYVISGVYGRDWASEERHEDHSYHDEPGRHSECAHCAINGFWRNGTGRTIAMVQLANAILAAGGPVKFRRSLRSESR